MSPNEPGAGGGIKRHAPGPQPGEWTPLHPSGPRSCSLPGEWGPGALAGVPGASPVHPSLPFTWCKLQGEQTEPGLWGGGGLSRHCQVQVGGSRPPLIHGPYRRVTRRLYKSNTQWAQLSPWFEFSSFLLSFVLFFFIFPRTQPVTAGVPNLPLCRLSTALGPGPEFAACLPIPASLGLAGRCIGRRKRGLGAGSGRDGDDFRSDCTDQRTAA